MDVSIKQRNILSFVFIVVSLFLGFYSYDRNFQLDSELLVSGPIIGKLEGLPANKYVLGRYSDVMGDKFTYDNQQVQRKDKYKDGYALDAASIVLAGDYYTHRMLPEAQYVIFANGQKVPIQTYHFDDEKKQVTISLDSNDIGNRETYGDISKIRFVDESGNLLPEAAVGEYPSQYGLQGHIFLGLVSNHLSFKQLKNLYKGSCILVLSIVLAFIIWGVAKKYNILLAIAFFLTFMTSPWVRNFSPNLYWVEFTWFIPMLIGLWASMHLENKHYKVLACLFAFISVLIKALCGYEYISTVMLALIAFPLTDAIYYHMKRNYKARNCAVILIIGLGIFALAGFIAALAIHGYYRGDGNVWQGLQSIYRQDVLRRTWGGNSSLFANGDGGGLWKSFDASVWTVLKKYIFKWHTEVLLGLEGKIFPLIAISPVFIWGILYKYHKLSQEDLREIILYIVFFFVSISWFVLAKSHSYIHTHMNYVLWYFGFVQICLYSWLKAGFLYLENKGFLTINKLLNGDKK